MSALLRLVAVTHGEVSADLPAPYRLHHFGEISLLSRPLAEPSQLSNESYLRGLLAEDLDTLAATQHGANFILFRLDTLAASEEDLAIVGQSLAEAATPLIAHMGRHEERRLTLRIAHESTEEATSANFLQAASRASRQKSQTTRRLEHLKSDITKALTALGAQIDWLPTPEDAALSLALLIPAESSGPVQEALATLLSADDIEARLGPRQPIMHFAPTDLMVEPAHV